MSSEFYFSSPSLLQKEILRLHMKRKKGKLLIKRTGRLTKNQRLLIFQKSDGRCHVCSKELTIDNFQADHIISHISGGTHKADNYLASCNTCNNYRWHYLPEELQLILKIGVWAKTEIEKQTLLGQSIAIGYVKKETRRLKSNVLRQR